MTVVDAVAAIVYVVGNALITRDVPSEPPGISLQKSTFIRGTKIKICSIIFTQNTVLAFVQSYC